MKISPNAPQARMRSAGFTLMEMMLVLLIIALIMGGVAVTFQSFANSAEVTTTKTKIQNMEASLMAYRTNNGWYPTQQQGLDALATQPTVEPLPRMWKPLVKSDSLYDAWRRKLAYRNPGKHNSSGVDVYSLGEDGVDGTKDDLGNW
ncbi:type II secretion system protein G (GspG) [Roseimicrobium gellanilyticum]|uniref:Type II secretion system core protein G n=1 Tax=Roseimicrobium gellanilyticum TaxID=748857 RepID=A0A366H0G4_9BACT|nr:type II secretion system major pseudopilin GspG [Roseimicrobium gellanilyticum]RBP35339.1 type II secretion system protein G (GspG) [Roseimicrobium gellanilyticum]